MQEQDLPGLVGLFGLGKQLIFRLVGQERLDLNLGVIDDNDFTYFNGAQIGHTEGWMAPNKIPKNL